MSEQALSGVRVLDIATFMAAPMAAMWLGDFGADVVHVEHPQGDGIRTWGSARDGVPLFWKMVGRNKRCITIDFHTEAGQELIRRLVREVDVLVENFRPGTLARWGIAPAQLMELNPRLVVLSMSTYGQTGPYSPRAGFGTLAEAMSGYAHVTGQADGPPTLPSFGLADSIAGLCGAYGVLIALYERDRQSGRGQHIDLGIYEPMLTMLGHQVVEFDQLGIVAQRLGSRLPFAAPRNIYRTADEQWVAMSCSSQSVFERACHAIDCPSLASDMRFIDNRSRSENHATLDAVFQDWIGQHKASDVIDKFTTVGAAIAPIYDMRDVFSDPHFVFRENIIRVSDPELGEIRMQNVVPALSRTPGQIHHAGPTLGAHTDEVLTSWLDLSAEDLSALRATGAI
jgi:crotonobetainyl-CoA:carnitine CoA-transferase CaiB-like acyl-CoA transferase